MVVEGGFNIGRLVSLVGSCGVVSRDCNFAKLQTKTDCLAYGGECGGCDNVQKPPHNGVRKAGMHGCGNDVRDEKRARKVYATLCAADERDEGYCRRAGGGY